MVLFETDEDGFIENIHCYDLLFQGMELSGGVFSLLIQDDIGRKKTKITLKGVSYMEVKELIPCGIVLSCYSFDFLDCPMHLQENLDFSRMLEYVGDKVEKIFYADGTMGFELLIAYSSGSAEMDNSRQGEQGAY